MKWKLNWLMNKIQEANENGNNVAWLRLKTAYLNTLNQIRKDHENKDKK